MTYLTMSQKEIDQIGIFEKLQHQEISQGAAAHALGLSTRQVRRKLKKYQTLGASSLVHGARGKPGNRQLASELCEQAITLVHTHYPDFGPTLATEKLEEIHGVKIGKETVRKLMTAAGLWKPQGNRQRSVHLWRVRRTCLGDLVQLDGSHHAWFEERAHACCLLAFIDDATSKLLWLEFCGSESTECLLRATWHYLAASGRPRQLYTDRGGVYKVNLGNQENDKETQYSRALKELEIGLIFARSPQAKGRVERVFGTLQDRLVKELRLQGISNIVEANHYLWEEYLGLHNAKFAITPQEPANLHRSLDGFDLPAILCAKETRKLQADWCLSYQNRWLQVLPKQQIILAKREKITVSHHLDGTLHLCVRGTSLAFRELLERPVKPLREKLPDLRHLSHKPAADHPWKTIPFDYSTQKSGHF